MRDIKSDLKTRNLVNHSFQRNAARPGQICDWPVVGGHYVSGEEPIELVREMMEKAIRAVEAREWFKLNGPSDAPPLPLSNEEREALRDGGLGHLLKWYARSLEASDYDVLRHPSFGDYARGVMASNDAPDFIKQNKKLRRRWRPKSLAGLGPGLVWKPPA